MEAIDVVSACGADWNSLDDFEDKNFEIDRRIDAIAAFLIRQHGEKLFSRPMRCACWAEHLAHFELHVPESDQQGRESAREKSERDDSTETYTDKNGDTSIFVGGKELA